MAKEQGKKSTSKEISLSSLGLSPGDQVPASTAVVSTDGIASFLELKGQITVLYFYPKDKTSGCTLEGRDFKAQYPKFKKLGVEIVGVSPDTLKSHLSFANAEEFPFPLLSDESKELCQLFGVWKEKSMYGRKYMGVERSTFVLDKNLKIVQEWRKVKVPGHVETVLEAVKAL